jgi:hypothetical protein
MALALLTWAHSAGAHGIAGNRYFDGTLTFDDPAVADEAILPSYTNLAFPAEVGNVVQNVVDWSFARLLTPTLALTYDSGWIHQNWPLATRPDLPQLTLVLNTKHIATISMKRWYHWASPGVSVTRARKQ